MNPSPRPSSPSSPTRGALHYREVPIAYRQRLGVSRALPIKKIPRAVGRVLGDLRALKHELRSS